MLARGPANDLFGHWGRKLRSDVLIGEDYANCLEGKEQQGTDCAVRFDVDLYAFPTDADQAHSKHQPDQFRNSRALRNISSSE